KYDGEINPLDFVQIKLIIVGKEKELTLIDGAERIVTVHKPVERTVHADRTSLELAKIVKVEKDRIVGVDSSIQSGDWKMLFPDYQDISTVGGGGCKAPPDCEAILRLNPDVVFLSLRSNQDACAAVLEYAGITVIRSWYRYGVWGSDIWLDAKKFGYIFDKQDEAEEFCDFLNNYMNPIKETVKEIPEEDKPTAYFESFPYSLQEFSYGSIENAGGKDIFADLEYWGRDIKLEPEEVIERNPDIIFKMGLRATISGKDVGYLIDAGNTAKLEGIKDEIMSRSELQNVKAVKEGRVYVMTGYIMYSGAGSGCSGFLQEAYMAKWLHPELFKAVDPKAIHQEYLTEFLEVDID
ncbi:MAG: ABC transporter substrate-binding protein, partial [Methanophagales archaeon]|nr:ABC transporter substrate-binding protein [Methanophagales archaeon]